MSEQPSEPQTPGSSVTRPPDRPPDRAHVVVLGAGPAGLAAAWYAQRRGLRVRVLDRASKVGGLAGSIIVDGQRVDYGSHRLHPSTRSDLLDDVRSVVGELQLRKRRGRIRLSGRWLEFPLRPADLARHAPPRLVGGVLRDMATAPVRSRRSGALSFGGLARAGMGPTVARLFYEPYAQKLWNVDPAALSPELFRRRVGTRSTTGIVRRLVRRNPMASSFWYPTRGFGEIAEGIASAIVAGGGTIELDCTIGSITTGVGGPVVHRTDGRSIGAGTIVSTIPGRDLTALAGAPPSVRSAADNLEFRGAVLVYMSVPRAQYTPFDAHYFPEGTVSIARLSESKRYRDCGDDPADRTVLCAEVPASVGDDSWTASDGALADRVRSDLLAVGLPDPQATVVHVERRPHVYPVYRLGYEHPHRQVADWSASLAGVVALGRQALFAHDNTHHALLMGHAAAQCLGHDGQLDRAAWLTTSAGFSEHVVED